MKKLIFTAFLFLSLQCASAPSDDFVFVVNTDILGDGSTEFKIDVNAEEYDYKYMVDCNDDGMYEAYSLRDDYVCDYSTLGGPGTYTIRITENIGDGSGFPHFYTTSTINAIKITQILQWGTGKWQSMRLAFYRAHNMVILATDIPDLSEAKDLSWMFGEARIANPDVSGWDVSSAEDISFMFYDMWNANPDVSNWDVSSVIYMAGVFGNNTNANPNVSNWNVSSVRNMSFMFAGARNANPDVSLWDVSKVTDMSDMFFQANSARPGVKNWNVSNVTDMSGMFYGADVANPEVQNWNVSNVTNMHGMFGVTTLANPDVSLWDVSSVENMQSMFIYSVLANPDVSHWNTSNVTNISHMFYKAVSAKPDLSQWNISSVTDMDNLLTRVYLSPRRYDEILMNFNEQGLPSNVSLEGGVSQYCNGETARSNIISNNNWVIEDDGKNCGADVSVKFSHYDRIQPGNSWLQMIVTNEGFQDVQSAQLTTDLLSVDSQNIGWSCEVADGNATCPNENGTGNLNESLNLNQGDELIYNIFFHQPPNEFFFNAKAIIDINEADIYYEDNQAFFTAGSNISESTSGSWFDPDNPGHGVFIEILDGEDEYSNDRINMYWFTYYEGRSYWMGGVGEIVEGQATHMTLYFTENTNFPPDFDVQESRKRYWGHAILDFYAPHELKLHWNSGFNFGPGGTIILKQLSKISQTLEGCLSGSFLNPDEPGHGLFIHVTDRDDGLRQINTAWFVNHLGEPFWLVGSGLLNDDGTANVAINQYSGASFFDPDAINGWTFIQEGFVFTEWGELSLTYTDNDNIEVEYLPNDISQFQPGEIDMIRLTSIKDHGCEDQ